MGHLIGVGQSDAQHIGHILPLMLTVQDVADVLGIGLAHAYEVAHRQDFPTITLGSRIIVPRDKFMAWIDEQSAKKTEIF